MRHRTRHDGTWSHDDAGSEHDVGIDHGVRTDADACTSAADAAGRPLVRLHEDDVRSDVYLVAELAISGHDRTRVDAAIASDACLR